MNKPLKQINTRLEHISTGIIRTILEEAGKVDDCQMLIIGEPNFNTDDYIIENTIKSLKSGNTHYPPFNGRPDLIKAICRHEKESHDYTCFPNEVIVTAGATEGIFASLFSLLNPEDEVIIPTPGFSYYYSATKFCGGVAKMLNIAENQFQIDEHELKKLISPKTKAIILNSPNNPSGYALNTDSLNAVAKISSEEGIYVICDDVYRDLTYTGIQSFSNITGTEDRTIILQSLSKPYSMTGWRLGYMICRNQHVLEALAHVHQNLVTSAVNFTQDGAIQAFKTDLSPYINEYRIRRDFVVKRLRQIGFNVSPPDGAFYVFLKLSDVTNETDSAKFCIDLIRKSGVALMPGIAFNTEGYVRLSYCCDMEEIKKGIDRLESYLKIKS